MTRSAAVVLAAGQGTRYRAADASIPTKLVADWRGQPLVRCVAESALASRAAPVVVVTGHARAAVEAALAGLAVTRVYNPAHATGIASSLRAGVAALPEDVAGVVILLGDMPAVTAEVIDHLLDAASEERWDAVVPVVDGRRGNPVYLSRRLFPAVARLEGDAGARHLLRQDGLAVREVTFAGDSTAVDVDEPGDLGRLGSRA